MITRTLEGIRAVKNGESYTFYGAGALKQLQSLGDCDSVEFFKERRTITDSDFLRYSTVKEDN